MVISMKVERLDHYGRGISYIDGKITFVENALDNEMVDIKNIKENKKYNEAIVTNLISKSKDRVVPKCKYYNLCGGCSIEHMSVNKQISFKKDKLENILGKFLKRNIAINDLVKLNNFNYRNKVVLHVKNNKLGFYQNGTNELVEIDECLLLNEKINDILKLLKQYIKEEPNLEKITIKLGNKTDEVMLIIDGTVKNYESLLKVSDCLIINNKCITKKDYINSYIGSKKYIIRKNTFFQVNYDIATRLYDDIKSIIINKNSKNVLDLYCGSGTIGIYISDIVENVIGIEVVEDAVISAEENVRLNNIKNVKLILGKVEEKLDAICNNNIDTIIVDPPRSGLHKRVIDTLKKIKAENIIYISCDPITMARDLSLLNDCYEIEDVTPYDMFPNTYHVECVCVLNRR